MKICFVTANHAPEANGGTEQVVTALEALFRRAGHEVVAISGSDELQDGRDVIEDVVDGVDVLRIRKLPEEHDRHGFVRPRIVQLVRERLLRLRPDLVHVHSFAGLGLGIAAACRELGVPVVFTAHDLWTTCARFFRLPAGGVQCPTDDDRSACVTCVNDALQTDAALVARALDERHRLIREELALADAVTAPSRVASEFVRAAVPYEGPITVIPHGLLREIPPEHRAPAPVAGERVRVGTFGGLVPEKGIRELVVALAEQDCELHLYGPFYDPDFAAELRSTAGGQALTMVAHGRYTAADPHPARGLHLAVFPSKCQETYGLVVDEALAHGVPVVCSDSGALAERATTAGVVVTPIAALAETLHDLLGSPARLAELRASIPAALPTIATSARRHLDLYRSLL